MGFLGYKSLNFGGAAPGALEGHRVGRLLYWDPGPNEAFIVRLRELLNTRVNAGSST